ncbi:dienelactone hydrolase family protein [Ottowia sp.]|uniref:dienelactone hydrolase family protein n=1 Tax=Ottowia sp. TaxID=1898956 RepID=UPI003A88D439
MKQWVDLAAADGRAVPAYVARPNGVPKGAVVVVQEIFGVNSHIRSVADDYAQDGYLAVAPSTFERVKPGVELGYAEADMKEGMGYKGAVEALPAPGVMQDLQAAIDYAAQHSGGQVKQKPTLPSAKPHHGCGKVGMVGYCWGGLLTWRAACTLHGLAAAVPYYGGGMTRPEEMARQPQVPVLAHLSDRDQWVPMDSIEAFKNAHPEVEVHLYAAQHGFNCDQRGAWDAAAAKLARERSLAFLAKHLA